MKALVLLLILSVSASSQPTLIVSDRLTSIGSPVAFTLNPPLSGTEEAQYFIWGRRLAAESTGVLAIWMPDSAGYFDCHALINNGSTVRYTDTVTVFVVSLYDLERAAFMVMKYRWKKQTFPDTAIFLPRHSVVLGRTHYTTTLRTTIEYLNPAVK